MAIEALFNSSYDKLLSRTRIASANDAQTVDLVDMAVSEVRVNFYKALGSTRVNQIVSYALAENPRTDEELLRADAANIEALWLTLLLVPRLPTMFMASEHLTNQVFNEEPLTRESRAIKDFIAVLQAQIDDGLAGLVVVPEDYESKEVRASSIGAETPYKLKDHYHAFGVFNR